MNYKVYISSWKYSVVNMLGFGIQVYIKACSDYSLCVKKIAAIHYSMGHFIFRLNLSFKPNRNLNA